MLGKRAEDLGSMRWGWGEPERTNKRGKPHVTKMKHTRTTKTTTELIIFSWWNNKTIHVCVYKKLLKSEWESVCHYVLNILTMLS